MEEKLLLENGDAILLEDGFNLLLETEAPSNGQPTILRHSLIEHGVYKTVFQFQYEG